MTYVGTIVRFPVSVCFPRWKSMRTHWKSGRTALHWEAEIGSSLLRNFLVGGNPSAIDQKPCVRGWGGERSDPRRVILRSLASIDCRLGRIVQWIVRVRWVLLCVVCVLVEVTFGLGVRIHETTLLWVMLLSYIGKYELGIMLHIFLTAKRKIKSFSWIKSVWICKEVAKQEIYSVCQNKCH